MLRRTSLSSGVMAERKRVSRLLGPEDREASGRQLVVMPEDPCYTDKVVVRPVGGLLFLPDSERIIEGCHHVRSPVKEL